MSLKTVHILFVALSALLAFAFGGWCLRFARTGGDGSYLAMGIASFASGGLLLAYGAWFRRKVRTREEERTRRKKTLRPLPVIAAAWALSARAAEACSVCYGEAEGPMIDAARLGVWLLFGLVLLLQVAFVAFFIRLHRRAKRYREKHPEMRWAD